MDPRTEENLRRADRESRVIRLRFQDGTSAEARIRDIDWDGHRTVTYLDMDRACCACTADLDTIAEAIAAENGHGGKGGSR